MYKYEVSCPLNSKEDIRGEAVKALHGGSSRSELDAEKRRNLTLPDFTQMIQYIRAQVSLLIE